MASERHDEFMGKIAIVFCGGGSRGAAEIGFYCALQEAGIQPDLIVGTSVGAVVGAYVASGLESNRIRQLWIEWSRQKRFRFNWKILWKLRRAEGLLRTDGLCAFLEDTLPVKRFEDLKIPLTIIATDLRGGDSVLFEKGDLIPAILASTAVPLYFPPVRIGQRQLVDGGITNNVALDVAFKKGAKKIYAMLCTCQDELRLPALGLFEILSRAFHIATRQKLRMDLERLRGKIEIILFEHCFKSSPGLLEFSRSIELMDEAYLFVHHALNERMVQQKTP